MSALQFLKKIIPKRILTRILPWYHFLLALIGAIIYGFPSRKVRVIGVTGTKGKTTTIELLGKILQEAGYRTAIASTLHFTHNNKIERNLFKMSMPGRFFLQRFLARAIKEQVDFVIIEMTSEGAVQYRHKFIAMDALIFTNLSPEHIESHGSYENYVAAKILLARSLNKSRKKNRVLVYNADDKESARFIAATSTVPHKLPFSIKDVSQIECQKNITTFLWKQERIKTALRGKFNILNIIAAATCATFFGVDLKTIARAVAQTRMVRGRMEFIFPKNPALAHQQNFNVVIDYAHTPDSLKKVYDAFPQQRKICVLGGTGGGRDKWKRPVMGKIASEYCAKIILTNEDPYDEDPQEIINDIKKGIKDLRSCDVVIDRKEAIGAAISEAKEGDVVIVTGKGTDPFIMGPDGTKIPWDDAHVARTMLEKKLSTKPSS